MIVSKFVSAFVLVIAMGLTTKSDLKEVMKTIRGNDLNVIGAVLTRMKISKKGYAYGYGYGHSRSYGASYFADEDVEEK